MKAKIINKVLRKKFDSFTDTIKDEELKSIVRLNTIITGGAIVSLLCNEKPNDYDLYFRDKNVTRLVAEYYVKDFLENNKKNNERDLRVVDNNDRIEIMSRSSGIAAETKDNTENYQYFEQLDPGNPAQSEYFEQVLEVVKADKKATDKKEYRPVFLTSNAITLSNKIQLIIRFYGEPEEIHENYDFIHCTNYWTSWDNEVVLNIKALEAILTKQLIYVGSKYPLCSLIRARKFIKRDWTCNAGQYLKIAMQLSELDLNSYSVLKEQLIGVDVAYFYQLLEALRKKDPENIDTTYVAELVDKIF